MSLIQIDVPAWYKDAPCAEVGGNVWFPESRALEDGEVRMSAKPAMEMCAKCRFKDVCRELAVTDHINWGIWGGTTPKQRVAIRRERGIAEREESILDLGELIPLPPLELETFDVDSE